VLGIFHVAKEVGKMNDACHIGFGELNAPRQLELKSHAGRFSGWPAASMNIFVATVVGES
jgi:hypothetical protein